MPTLELRDCPRCADTTSPNGYSYSTSDGYTTPAISLFVTWETAS